MATMEEKQDVEANYHATGLGSAGYRSEDEDIGTIDEVKRARDFQHNISIFRHLRQGEEWLDRKMGVELQGIDRIPEEKKQPPSTWNVRHCCSS